MRSSVFQKEKGLTDLQERFCQEYLIDLNGLQAYRRAQPDVSDDVAKSNGHRLLTYAHIQARITELGKVIAQETKLTAVNVLRELAIIVFMNPPDIKIKDKLKALDLAMKHLRLLGNTEAEQTKDIAALILGAQARLKRFRVGSQYDYRRDTGAFTEQGKAGR